MEEHANHDSVTHAHHGEAPDGHEAHAGHDKHAGHSCRDVPRQVPIVAAPDAADARLGAHAPERARVSRAALHRQRVDPGAVRHRGVRLWRLAVPAGRVERATRIASPG